MVLYFIKKPREVIEMDKKIKVTEEIKKLSFEEAISELERIVEDLERGDIELEDSISIYELSLIHI